MTNRHFSATAFSNFSSPSQGIATPSPFTEMAILEKAVGRGTITSTANGHSSGNGAAATAASIVFDAWSRFDQLKLYDNEKNNLLEEMITRYSLITNENQQLLMELERQKEFNRTFIQSSPTFKNEYEVLKHNVERDPFVLVIIDGDGMLFHDQLLEAGISGGMKAAELLYQSARVYAREVCPDLPTDFKIVARMYANIKGLGDVCSRAGIISNPVLFEEFAQGFTKARSLFDFVDVGPSRDQANEKVSEIIKLHTYDVRCKHIIFGCSHENAFARLLEKYIFDKTITDRVTLLEGTPFEKELVNLPYQRQKFGSIFRSEKVNVSAAQILGAAALRAISYTPTESVSSTSDATYTKPSAIASWASKAASAATTFPPTPPVQKSSPVSTPPTKESISRNRKGQRIDPALKYDKVEVDRMRKLKMCNVHFLRKECPYGDKCTHRHDRIPSPKEMDHLRVVARMAACRNGSSCDDPKCIYGHRCQAPERLDKGKFLNDGGKSCIFGPECVFEPELHGVDLSVVRTTKV